MIYILDIYSIRKYRNDIIKRKGLLFVIYISKMNLVDKANYRIGDMAIDNKQIFWKMKYCYALIPIVQLLDGRTH